MPTSTRGDLRVAKMFDEQMQVLAQCRGTVDAVSFSGGDVFSQSDARVAVTFDDGYLDNVVAALPILERHEIPATIFVIGNAVGRTREFWWDALERAILAPRYCPVNSDRFSVPIVTGSPSATTRPAGRGRTLASRCRCRSPPIGGACSSRSGTRSSYSIRTSRIGRSTIAHGHQMQPPGSVQQIMVDDKGVRRPGSWHR